MVRKSAGSSEIRYSIGAVSRQTGLKPDLLRAWERRFGTVVPGRTETNRRYYTRDDVHKLRLLKRAIDGGHRIGQLASLSVEQLEELVGSLTDNPPGPAAVSEEASSHVKNCLDAVADLDADRLQESLARASVHFGHAALLEQVLAPLIRGIGDAWEEERLGVAHEHLASVVVVSFLSRLRAAYPASEGAPRLLLATPSGHRHELGALLAAATAATEGWDVVYLGPDLPAGDIVQAARLRPVRAVGVSLVYPRDEPATHRNLNLLRRLLEDNIPLLLGGQAAAGYAARLRGANVLLLETQRELRTFLSKLKSNRQSDTSSGAGRPSG